MAGDTTITIIGNLTDDPELKFTSSGVAVTNFRLASTPRLMDKASGQWKDGDPLFMKCTAWRQAAENIAESLQRGARVVVVGRLRQRSYETQQGEKRTVIELEVDEVGPSLRYATARVQKMSRGNDGGGGPSSGGFGGGFGSSGSRGGTDAPREPDSYGSGGFGSSGNAEDPWATAAPQGAAVATGPGRDQNAKYDPDKADDGPPF